MKVVPMGKQEFPEEVKRYFPFQPRPGQVLMANEIYHGVLNGKDVAIEGAAGLGKTSTSLSALLPICKQEGLLLLYVARTHSQMQRVMEELRLIQKRTHQELTAMCLYGRANLCLHPQVSGVRMTEAMELCRMLRKGHQCRWYEHLQGKELATVRGCFSADYLLDVSKKAAVCPYYLSLRLLSECDVIALPYVYLLNPFIRPIFLKRLGRALQDCVLVLDECHNIPELAMDAVSVVLSSRGIARALQECAQFDATGEHPQVLQVLQCFVEYFTGLEQVQEQSGMVKDEDLPIDKSALLDFFKGFFPRKTVDLYAVQQELQAFGREIKQKKLAQRVNPYSSIHHVGLFLERFMATFRNPQYLHYATLSPQHVVYHIRCMDCRPTLDPLLQARARISMSGTLEPIPAYLDITGFPSSTRQQVLPSPFPRENIRVFCMKQVEVSYYNRSPTLYELLARRCSEAVQGSGGNTAIFCPSYDVLENLHGAFLLHSAAHGWNVYVEHRTGTSLENEALITQYKADGRMGQKSVLLGVCGGRNSEGVDFPGAEMVTVIICGIPLARLTFSMKAMVEYYTREFGTWRGREYAYIIPAFRRANQAAGRPIRQLTDRGVVVLLDERYSYPYYRRFLSHWVHEDMVFLENRDRVLTEELHTFFAIPPSKSPLATDTGQLEV